MADEQNSPTPTGKLEPTRGEASGGLDRLEPLIPLAEQLLNNYNRELEGRVKLHEKQMEANEMQAKRDFHYDKDALKFEQHKFDRQYVLVVIITVFVLATAGGLIFFRQNTEAGILLLSHVAALAIGLVGGAGWQKARKDDE